MIWNVSPPSLSLFLSLSPSFCLSPCLSFPPLPPLLFLVGHETESWSVYRRYLEFYVLESKLTEFHGTHDFSLSLSLLSPILFSLLSRCFIPILFVLFHSYTGSFQDAQLPSKRIIGPKNFEFLNSKRVEFEEYLQVTWFLSAKSVCRKLNHDILGMTQWVQNKYFDWKT